jgi:hypothetical protein
MIQRMTAAMVMAIVLAAPAMASAQGPNDVERAKAIVNQIAQHSCEAARRVADLFGVKVACPKADDPK